MDIYQRKVTLSPLPEARFSSFAADVKMQQSKQLGQLGKNIEDKAANNDYLRRQKTMSEEINRIELTHKNSPDSMQEALGNFSTSFLEEVWDPEVKTQLELQYQTKSSGALSRAIAGRDKIMTEQQQFETLDSIVSMKKEAINISRNLFNPNGIVSASAIGEVQELVNRAQNISSQVGPDGTPLLSPVQRLSSIEGVLEGISETAAISWFDGQPNKEAALKRFEKDGLSLELPDGKGGFTKVNLADNMSQGSKNYIKSEVRRQEAERKAIATAQAQERSANLDITIGTARTGDQLAQAKEQLEANKNLLTPSDYASKTVKLFRATEEITGDLNALAVVNTALTNGDPLNVDDPKISKALDNQYVQFATKATQDPNAIELKASFVSQIGAVPKAMKQEISTGLRSNDEKTVMAYVQQVDAIRKVRPDVIADMPSDTMRYANLIQSNLDLGYEPVEAILNAKEMLKVTPVVEETRKDDFKEAVGFEEVKSYIKSQQHSFWADDPNEVPSLMIEEIRRISEQEYIKVGDLETAQKTALDQALKTWAKTEVGSLQWMKNAPEKHYSIPNLTPAQNSEWIKEQFENDTKALDIDDPEIGAVYNQERGRYEYPVMYRDEYDTLRPVIGNDGKPASFVPDKDSYLKKYKKERGELLDAS